MIPLRGRCRTLSFQEVRGQNSWELLAKDMLGTKRPWNMHVNIYMYCIYTVCLHHSKLLMVHILTSSKDVASRPCLLERTVSDRIFYQNCLTKKKEKRDFLHISSMLQGQSHPKSHCESWNQYAVGSWVRSLWTPIDSGQTTLLLVYEWNSEVHIYLKWLSSNRIAAKEKFEIKKEKYPLRRLILIIVNMMLLCWNNCFPNTDSDCILRNSDRKLHKNKSYELRSLALFCLWLCVSSVGGTLVASNTFIRTTLTTIVVDSQSSSCICCQLFPTHSNGCRCPAAVCWGTSRQKQCQAKRGTCIQPS